MASLEEIRRETEEAIRQFKAIYGDRTEIDRELLEDPRCYDDGIGTGRIDLSGMTQEEYTEWLNSREDNTQDK